MLSIIFFSFVQFLQYITVHHTTVDFKIKGFRETNWDSGTSHLQKGRWKKIAHFIGSLCIVDVLPGKVFLICSRPDVL